MYTYKKTITTEYDLDNLIEVDVNENGLTELVRDLRSTYDQFIPEFFLTYPTLLTDYLKFIS